MLEDFLKAIRGCKIHFDFYTLLFFILKYDINDYRKDLNYMQNIASFYEKTKNALPHKNTKKFVEMNNKNGNATDLGCGAGRDTIFLIKNNWNVIAIDKEDTQNLIEANLNAEELKKLKFLRQNFEEIHLEKSDLIVSNFSIPFCSKNYFDDFWVKVVNSINSNRIFCGKFFWNK